MLINTNHRATDQRPTDSSDTTQDPTPLHRRPYWNQTSAAFSAALWLPAGTTDRGSLINTAHGWTSNTAASNPESTEAMYAGVDTRVDGQGRANRPGQVPIDGDEGGVK